MRTVLLILIFILSMLSCSKSEVYNIKLPFVTILKRASLYNKYPGGFLQIGFMIDKEGKGLINSEDDLSKIKSIKVSNSIKEYHIEKKSFGMINSSEFNGYIKIGNLKQYMFIVSDLNFNEDNVPNGNYLFSIETVDGRIYTQNVNFTLNKSKNVSGFPENIKVNQNTLEVSWKGTKNHASYRLYVFKGKKGIVEDWSSLVFDTSYIILPDTSIVLPRDKFSKGDYYIYVEAYNPPFFNLQDKDDHIGLFTIE
ncbi:MAG TPA: hypothetical protein PKW55_08810 [Spirochaetota bacterium]|nr:hypothetical protein [Spirochaetota bacterium]HOM39177.1 hypothetical protein [Spirochaetota bacterium]HPQ50031.1 hypothetical protein [Spirochaetota bacterium]